MRKLQIKPLLFVGVLVGVFSSGFMVAKIVANPHSPANTEILAAQYPLLAKHIFLDTPSDNLINFVPLRKILQDKLSKLNVPYSFSFEYLPTGTTIRSGDDQELVGASLIKLPVVMDLYRAAELGIINLDDTHPLSPDVINTQFGDLYKRGVGARLSLREAARIALSKSDNTAILFIQKYERDLLPPDVFALDAVDADYDAQADQVLINSKSYSSVLKCLYFACYINRADSQEVLSYLTESSFDSGIAKPIPPGTKVAHKIGTQDDKISQSDCGIVYVPQRPYVLCVMLNLPETEANQLLADLSSTVYDSITKRN